MNIYVGNIPYTTGETELKDLFTQFGEVTKATVINDRETGRSKGFGFIEMSKQEEGQTAIDQLNGKDFGGRNIKVNEARPKPNRNR